jgi:hypothetical protein
MKTTKTLLVGAFAVSTLFTSCKSDDGAQASLEGKWIYAKEGGEMMGKETLIDHPHKPGCSKDYIEFLASGVYNDVIYGYDCAPDTFPDTYVRDGKNLMFTDLNAGAVQILKLTDKELKTKAVHVDGGTTYSAITTYVRE